MVTAASQGAVVVFHSPWIFEPVPTGVPVLMYTYLKTIKILRREKKHCRWSDIVDRCWKNGNDKAIICLQDRKLKLWSDIIASKCLILKRSSDNVASKIQNVRWSDNDRSSDHDWKIALSELRTPLVKGDFPPDSFPKDEEKISCFFISVETGGAHCKLSWLLDTGEAHCKFCHF